MTGKSNTIKRKEKRPINSKGFSLLSLGSGHHFIPTTKDKKDTSKDQNRAAGGRPVSTDIDGRNKKLFRWDPSFEGNGKLTRVVK